MKFLVALLLVCLPGWGQTPARARKAAKKAPAVEAPPPTFPIGSLTVKGNVRLPAAAILGIAGLKIGDAANKEVFEAARQRIADTGMFDSVGYRYAPVAGEKIAYDAELEVVEIKPMYKVEFAAMPGKPEELGAYLKSRDPLYTGFAPPAAGVLDRWSHFLEDYLAEKNQPQKVTAKVVPTAGSDYLILFQPDKPPPAVARVEFSGSKAIDELELTSAIGAVAYGVPYTEPNFRDLLDSQVRPLFEQKGLLRVKFEDIQTSPMPPPVQGLIVKVKVEDGPPFKLGKVSLTGVTEANHDSLMDVAGLKTGDVVNFDDVIQAVERVQKATKKAGYFRAKTTYDRTIDDKGLRVNVIIKVQPGERYEFGKLSVKGLDLNGEATIRKLWGEKPGDPFNSEYPDRFLAHIREEDLFDGLGEMRSEIAANDQTHIADVTLHFLPGSKKVEKKKREE